MNRRKQSNHNIAIIPARGGSKRIPRKNIKSFCGKPIIKYSIEAALKSGCFDEIMVSTDDNEIAEISKRFGAKVPFLRSPATSNDLAGLKDVIVEVLDMYKAINQPFERCCCILATAPFIKSSKLIEGLNILKAEGVSSVFPIVRYSYPIQRSLKIENGHLKMFWPKNINKRSQDLISAYHDAGQFYWLNVVNFLKNKKIFANDSIGINLSDLEEQDIDTEEDWEIAELKYNLMNIK